jgi:hypothetical protein
VKVIGATGYSRGEDAFLAPPNVKQDPKSFSQSEMRDASGTVLPTKGLLVEGVLRDGDWNIALKWQGDNTIPNNPDEKTFDPNAVNWVNAPDYNTAASDYVAGKCEDRQLVKGGRPTGEKVHVCVNAIVTWTPGDVTAVKTDLGSTKAELERTVANLNKVTGDLGVQSGYIATNGKEIAALKRLGERNIFEFNLRKTKAPQRVGDISITLKNTDPKRNKYTIEVLADDKTTEKKDKTVHEPVQFALGAIVQSVEILKHGQLEFTRPGRMRDLHHHVRQAHERNMRLLGVVVRLDGLHHMVEFRLAD